MMDLSRRLGGGRSLIVMGLLLVAGDTFGHEMWVLTPEEVADWNASPKPPMFTRLTGINVFLLSLGIVFMVGWVLLGRTGAREMFPDLRLKLASYSGYASLAIRIGLAVMLGMAAFGLSPRHGTEMFEAPTLVAPDLELRLAPGNWEWIAWIETAAMVSFAFGIYVRVFAAALLVLDIVGILLFGYSMCAYFGIVAATAIYLLFRGAGPFSIPLPVPAFARRLTDWFENQPRLRVQLFVQVLAGINFVYLGIEYKLLQPNLSMAFLAREDVFTFGMEHQTFVFLMFLVETLAGFFMIFGVLMRAMSVILFGAFLFLSYSLGENPIGHIIFYGILFAFITNGGGRWRRPVATDKPGDIVILGGGFAAVQSALRLERLRDQYTNVRVTLIHESSNFLFHPLLAEVLGGSIQPGDIINPLRRICPRTRIIHHPVTSIDTAKQKVHISRRGESMELGYDRLIVALDREPDYSNVKGLADHGFPMMTIGDSLYLRQRILENLELAEELERAEERVALLTFCVVGGGLRGCATAAEIRNLLGSAVHCFSSIDLRDTRVMLVEARERILFRFGAPIAARAARRLARVGVEILTGKTVQAVTATDVVVGAERSRIPCATVVGTQSVRSRLYEQLPGAKPGQTIETDAYMRIKADPSVFVVAHGTGGLPFMAFREIRAGRHVAYNALASVQGFHLKPWRPRQPWVFSLSLGMRASVAQVFGARLSGRPAWILARFTCLFTLPGLERNLRILVDWLMDIVFRDDIAVLVPQKTVTMDHAHFEPGDTIIREGDHGDCAYIILSGSVKVTHERDGQQVRLATRVQGECFGEIALLSDEKRTATVTCNSPVEVMILHREQFLTLTEGFHDFGEALRKTMRERLLPSKA